MKLGFYFTKNDYKIAIVCSGLWYEGQSADIIRRVKEASEVSDFQIVFFHGGTEKVHAPDNYKVRAARKIVDAGADLVTCQHSHCIGCEEKYLNGKFVDPSNPERCFTFTNAEVKVQGTSSSGYPRKNFTLTFEDEEGIILNGVKAYEFKINDDSLPTNSFCFKYVIHLLIASDLPWLPPFVMI